MNKGSGSGGPGLGMRECREFARSFDSLEEIYAFVEPSFNAHGIAGADSYAIIMAIEELFTNMVKYNPDGKGLIGVEVQFDPQSVSCTLSDPDSDRFDPTLAPDADIRQPAEQRRPGGLGIHLVRRMVDSIDYKYEGRCSRISFARKRSGSLMAG